MASATCEPYHGTSLTCKCRSEVEKGESICICARDRPEVDVTRHITTVVIAAEEAKPEEVVMHSVTQGSGTSETLVPQEPVDLEDIFEFCGAGTE